MELRCFRACRFDGIRLGQKSEKCWVIRLTARPLAVYCAVQGRGTRISLLFMDIGKGSPREFALFEVAVDFMQGGLGKRSGSLVAHGSIILARVVENYS